MLPDSTNSQSGGDPAKCSPAGSHLFPQKTMENLSGLSNLSQIRMENIEEYAKKAAEQIFRETLAQYNLQ